MERFCSLGIVSSPNQTEVAKYVSEYGFIPGAVGSGLTVGHIHKIVENAIEIVNQYLVENNVQDNILLGNDDNADFNIYVIMFQSGYFNDLKANDSESRTGTAIDGNTVYLSPSHLFVRFINDRTLRDEIEKMDKLGNMDDDFRNYVTIELVYDILRLLYGDLDIKLIKD